MCSGNCSSWRPLTVQTSMNDWVFAVPWVSCCVFQASLGLAEGQSERGEWALGLVAEGCPASPTQLANTETAVATGTAIVFLFLFC